MTPCRMPEPQSAQQRAGSRIGLNVLECVVCLFMAACAAWPATTPVPGLNPTDFLATRVPQVLTANAATLTAAPSATPSVTPTVTRTPLASRTPTVTPTPEATAYPTPKLSNYPAPPLQFQGDPHFFFGRPIGAGGNVFIASSYRYGSTSQHKFSTHHGVEFPNNSGTPLVAVAPGVVYYAGTDLAQKFGPDLNFYGNLVVLQLSEAWLGHTVYALYGHMDTLQVQTGQALSAGDVVGTVGASGVALGAHLHLEVRLDAPDSYWETRNPELWLRPVNAGYGTLAVRVTDERARYLPGMRVGFNCADGAFRYLDTYWDNGVNPDDLYGENAAMTDVPAGPCTFETEIFGKKVKQTMAVQAGTVNFVWLRP